MQLSKAARLSLCVLIGLGLAIALGLQTAGTIATRTQPETALQLNPDNGSALGKYAFVLFSSAVQDGAETREAALSAEPWAFKGYREEPLNPRALAILAMAQADKPKERAILTEALKLNRRSLTLQRLGLKMHVEREDVPAAIAMLDQILRVHPERSTEFFPLLAGALDKEEVIPSFVRILANQPPWQERFLNFAVSQPAALLNTAKLRRQLTSDAPQLDSRIVTNLVRSGELAAASEHYAFAIETYPKESGRWPSAFPPFDWRFTDGRNMRAQVDRDGQDVELFVKSGSGGVVMERLFAATQAELQVTANIDISTVGNEKDVRLRVACAGTQTLLLDEPVTGENNTFIVPAGPSECGYLKLDIYARAYRGQPSLRATIQSIKIGNKSVS